MICNNWAPIVPQELITEDRRSLFTTFNINLFDANIYVEAPMNSQ